MTPPPPPKKKEKKKEKPTHNPIGVKAEQASLHYRYG